MGAEIRELPENTGDLATLRPRRVYNIVAGERPSLLMVRNTTTKCMIRSLNVTPTTTLRSGKYEA